MKRFVFFVMMASALYACGSTAGERQQQAEEEKKQDSIRAAEDIRSNMSLLNDFNAMEAVFGNENWMKIENKDTVYFYFSRLGGLNFNTYTYRLAKGDSSKVVYGKIRAEKNKLAWEFEGKKLLVTTATVARIAASPDGTDTAAKYEFTRLDNSSIGVTYPDQKKIVLKKTIPFGMFLVRARYDYANGTRYAFDTTDFRKHRK